MGGSHGGFLTAHRTCLCLFHMSKLP
jgi:hypothetical protein